jgi:creatinine amidohydrolase
MPLIFSHLTREQLQTLHPPQTVFLFPVGLLEDHGPHLPMGLDLHEASTLCDLAAQRLEQEMPGWTCVLMPAAPLGVDGITSESPLTVRAHVLRDWLVDACRALIRQDFIHFVAFSGTHSPKQLTAIEDAGKIIARSGMLGLGWLSVLARALGTGGSWVRARPSLISASSSLVSALKVRQSPLYSDPEEHGGKRDTSVALALSPELVGPHALQLLPVERSKSRIRRWFRHWRRKSGGYWGAPAQAHPEHGVAELREQLDTIIPKLRAVYQEGANPEYLFRSWYSVIPLNQSFFLAWILGFSSLLLIGVWFYLTWKTTPLSSLFNQDY